MNATTSPRDALLRAAVDRADDARQRYAAAQRQRTAAQVTALDRLTAGTTPDCGTHCPDAAGDLRGEPHCDRPCCHGKQGRHGLV
jgi:hypothetical protein